MKSVYERENLLITEFDTEDVITTSGQSGEESVKPLKKAIERENRYGSFDLFDQPPGNWF